MTSPMCDRKAYLVENVNLRHRWSREEVRNITMAFQHNCSFSSS